jgi:hypothetical protein
MSVPNIIFIVPYRDREAQKNMFTRMMEYVLEDVDDSEYEIYFSHQQDERPFNRGAMKNLGFIHIRNKYPNDYKNMSFVFNDVDTLPGIKNLWDYKTTYGVVKHYYGYKFALGGIISITGADFEKLNGFPNYWGWGFEDNCLQKRCSENNITIDRSIFYPLGHNNILQFNNVIHRTLDNKGVHKLQSDDGTNGLNKFTRISKNEVKVDKHFMINFTTWDVPEKPEDVILETRVSSNKVAQRKVNMMDIMRLR